MRTDVLNDVCNAIEETLELNGIETVDIENNIIKVKVANGRAFAKLFPNQEERVCVVDDSYLKVIKASRGCFEFSLALNEREYNEFKGIYGVTEIEVESEE